MKYTCTSNLCEPHATDRIPVRHLVVKVLFALLALQGISQPALAQHGYVTESAYSKVQVFSSNGTYKTNVCSRSQKPSRYSGPQSPILSTPSFGTTAWIAAGSTSDTIIQDGVPVFIIERVPSDSVDIVACAEIAAEFVKQSIDRRTVREALFTDRELPAFANRVKVCLLPIRDYTISVSGYVTRSATRSYELVVEVQTRRVIAFYSSSKIDQVPLIPNSGASRHGLETVWGRMNAPRRSDAKSEDGFDEILRKAWLGGPVPIDAAQHVVGRLVLRETRVKANGIQSELVKAVSHWLVSGIGCPAEDLGGTELHAFVPLGQGGMVVGFSTP